MDPKLAPVPLSEYISGILRSVNNQVKAKSLPIFQAVVCFGTYNANLIAASKASPFVTDHIFSTEYLNFTQTENFRLFKQYREEYEVSIDPNVVDNINRITGGHTGLTNACGKALQDAGDKEVSYNRWLDFQPTVVSDLKTRRVFQAILSNLKKAQESEKTVVLLRQLCYGPGTWDKAEQANINLKENGLARTEKKDGKDWIMIKSEMIKEFVIQDILKDANIFPPGELPMLPDQDKLDILQFLTAILRHFDPMVIQEAYAWTKKSHERDSQVGVPQEDVYQQQFGATVRRASLNQEWKAYSELRRDVDEKFRKDQTGKVDPKEAKSLALDFMLLRPTIDKIQALRVGIEFTASVDLASLREHARRRYSQVLKLDQYVVVNFTSYRTEAEFACDKAPGFDKNGHPCDIPIFHVLHDRDYKSVKLYSNNGQSVVNI